MSEVGRLQELLASLWEVETSSLPGPSWQAQAGGGGRGGRAARCAGPGSILEEFLNYFLAGDQRLEQAWAGPAG